MNRVGRKPYVDLTDRPFGLLIARERVLVTLPSGRVEGRWRCECACGGETTVRCSTLLNRNTKSCGCFRGRPMEYGRSARNSVLYRYKRNAEQAGRDWQINDELFDALTTNNCHYCGNPPTNVHRLYTGVGEFRYNGIDRKNSELGYTPENVVSCCKECQKAKSSTPYEQFLSLLVRAGRFQLGINATGISV